MTNAMLSRRSVGLRSERGPILLSVMLSTALVALDSTIIATASTSVAHDLGEFRQLPWLFSIYVLAQAVTVPLYGRLADVFGRKNLLLVALGLFLLGSILSGAAWSMPILIAARAVQGIGAGGVQPLGMTILSDIYSLEERAKTQGYIASMWGMASLVGPALGGVFSEYLSWRWIFWINVPIGAVAVGLIVARYHESARVGEREPIDWLGAALVTPGTALLVLGLLEGGQSWAWDSPISVLVFAAAAALLVVFVWWQLRARYPLIAFSILRRRVVWSSTAGGFLVGLVVLGLSAYVPIYAQDVLGFGPLIAGFAVAAFTIGWPITASFSGRFYLRYGFRVTCTIGTIVALAGSALLVTLGAHSSIWLVALYGLIIGAGFGFAAAPSMIAAQSSVQHSERGFVTGINMFSRNIGSAVGVAIFGAVVNANTIIGANGAPEAAGLMTAMRLVFVAIAIAAALLVVVLLFLPPHRSGEEPQPIPERAFRIEAEFAAGGDEGEELLP